MSDYELWKQYNRQRNDCSTYTPSCPQGDEVYIFDHRGDSIFNLNKKFDLEIGLSTINEIWGISYQLKYDVNLFKLAGSNSKINWANNRVGNFIHHHPYVSQPDIGIIEGVILNDQKGNQPLQNSRFNSFLHLTLQSIQPKNINSKSTEISICNVIVYYGDGKKEILPSITKIYQIPDDILTNITDSRTQQDIVIHPNPNQGQFSINAPTECALIIFDEKGHVIRRKTLTKGRNHINMVEDRRGLYFIQIQMNGTKTTRKMIVH